MIAGAAHSLIDLILEGRNEAGNEHLSLLAEGEPTGGRGWGLRGRSRGNNL